MIKRRRRSTPWIQRWSRVITGAIATVGLILTAYLSISALTGSGVVCSPTDAAAGVGSCDDVLSSPYAKVFGLPLPLYGMSAYLSMIAFSLSPYLLQGEEQRDRREKVEDWTKLLLLIGGTAMFVFSGYLMYVLAFKLQAVCYYCIGSALFSLSLFLITVVGHEWPDFGQIVTTGVIVAFVTLIVTLGVYSPVNNAASADGGNLIPPITEPPQPGIGWELDTTSSDAEVALAEHLSEQGAIMYGAYWCPHCFEQKQLFGKEAWAKVNYVECEPDATKVEPEPAKCSAAEIQGYPTWEIAGQKKSGRIPLEELADLSGYEGNTQFKYRLPE